LTPASELTVVVVAVGDEPAQKRGALKSLETKIIDAFVKDGRYSVITRDERTLKQIEYEHIFQRSGAVNEKEIRELGRIAGAKYLCSIKSSQVLESFMLEVALIDIETAKVIKMGSAHCDFVNMSDLVAASVEIARQLFGPNSPAVKSDGQPGGYGSGLYWDVESVRNPNPMSAELIRTLKQKVSVSDGTCVSGDKIAVESDPEPDCSEGMVGVTCKVNATLTVTRCQGNQKSVFKGSIAGADKYSRDEALKQMMRKAERADFWGTWLKELEARGKK
jgi:hypothetical protein